MITNERQYRISKALLDKLRNAKEAFDLEDASRVIGSAILAHAELEALKSELEVLSDHIREYDALKSGAIKVFHASNLGELPTILIRARIARGHSQRELAGLLGLKEQQIQRYESEGYSSASLRRLKEIADVLSLNITEVAQLEHVNSDSSPVEGQEIAWDMFPIKEMYRRGWFETLGFKGSMADAVTSSTDLVKAFVNNAMPKRQLAFLKQRARFGFEMDPYALWAWQCRVLLLAKEQPLACSYSRDSITDEWLQELAQESRFEDGPRRAVQKLAGIGIPLVIVPHLPKTYLDGAAFLLSGRRPVIGMTLRFDRLDNFWFVLFHELIHVLKHLKQGSLENIFDDLEAAPDRFEEEANQLAGNALIAESDWETALPRYVRTEESILSFATEYKIHSAIVAGRIRREANNYVIFSELVGSGKAREHFPDVLFAQ